MASGLLRCARKDGVVSKQVRANGLWYYISSAPLTAKAAAGAVRGHWGIENRLHRVLDVTFKEDLSRRRKGHGAKNIAVIRRFSINLVRAAKDKHSIKLRRKLAAWDQNISHNCSASQAVNLSSLP